MTYEDKRFDETFFCVEATSCEVQQIWKDLNQDRGWPWRQTSGIMVSVGELDIVGQGKKPVCICLMWNYLRGKLICFYEAISQIVDHKMVEQWIKTNIVKDKTYGGGREIMCDANNIHHMIHAIQDSQKIWAVRQTGKDKDPVSFDSPRDLAQFLFNQGEDESQIASCPYKFSYGPKDTYVHESDLSCIDMSIVVKELGVLWVENTKV